MKLLRISRIAALASMALAIGFFAAPADATHYRYGHVQWSPGAGANDINFVIQNAWRRNQGTCRDPNSPTSTVGCTGPGGLAGVGDIISQGASSPTFSFGDGNTFSFPGGVLHIVTSVDVDNNWYFGTVIDHNQLPNIVTAGPHTYAAPGNYTAFFADCCRISASATPNRHINNPDRNSRIEAIVNVGTGNTSPVALIPPVVFCGIDSICTFTVAASDPDGDPLRFRLATPQEATGGSIFVHPGPPNAPNAAVIDPNTGMVTWDTNGASLGGVDPTVWNVLYSTQVIIEDLDPLGNAKSKVAVDFFIQLVPAAGNPPAFTAGPCAQTLTIDVGNTLAFTVEATDPDPGDIVTLNVVGLPVGATMTPPLPTTGNPVSSDFSWTPTAGQVGTHIMTFSAVDQLGQSAPLCTVTVMVQSGPTGPGCVYSHGYWRRHPDNWPVNTLELGILTYTKPELRAILNEPTRGNGLVSLATQLIAALLNQANDASTPPQVQQAIDDAHALILDLVVPPVGTDSLHPSVTSELTAILDLYNNGLFGPPHCDD
jgi:hypothetical protein